MALHRFDVDGIPVFGADHDGPARAGLLFRVGMVDEPAARRGISHLVEHLALEGVGRPIHPFNGFTTPLTTGFVAQGTPAEVGAHLAAVCRSLHALPEHRFDVERRVLEAEALQRDMRSVTSSMWTWRYGCRGWGAIELGDIGLPAISFEDLRSWAAMWFAAGNAAAWVVAPDARAVLTELDLPTGGMRPPVPLVSMLSPLPAWATMAGSGPAIGVVGERSVALRWAMASIAERAGAVLRQEKGIVYGVVPTYEPLDATTAHAHVGADAAPEHHPDVAAVLLDAAHQIMTRGPNDDELARARRAIDDTREGPLEDREAGWAGLAALRLLDGVEPESMEDLAAAEDAVDGRAISRAMADAWPSAFLLLTPGCEPPAEGFAAAPAWSDPVEHDGQGFRERSVVGRAPQLLRIGGGRVTLGVPGSGVVSIHADTSPLVLRWDDGTRVIFGDDGMRVTIRPWEWTRAKKLGQALEAMLPADRSVHRGTGSGPPPRSGASAPLAVEIHWLPPLTVSRILLFFAVAMATLFAAASIAVGVSDGDWIAAAVFVPAAVLCGWAAVRDVQRWRRRLV